MTKKHTKRWSTSFVTREMQIKTKMRYHLTPTRIAIIKKAKTASLGADVVKFRTLAHCRQECKNVSATVEKHFGGSSKVKPVMTR